MPEGNVFEGTMLADKVAFVTGAGGAIGHEVALELARYGASIVINEFASHERAESLAAEIANLGSEAITVYGDVGVPADVERMVAESVAKFARIDILVNNAAIQTFGPMLDLPAADWDRVIRTNLTGCFLCTQAVARLMKEHGGGRIINLGSGCNKTAFPGLGSYTASKGGIETFTKVCASELGRYGITVNCIAPGAIETERTKLEAPDYAGTWSKLTPIGRVGTPSDVARVVAFFASDAAEFISGQTLWVDGGLFSKPAWPYDF